jgi:hypothetical protein
MGPGVFVPGKPFRFGFGQKSFDKMSWRQIFKIEGSSFVSHHPSHITLSYLVKPFPS